MEKDIYRSPESNLEVENEQGVELASRWHRLGSSFVDALTIIPFMLPLMYFTGGFDGILSGVKPSLLYSFMISMVSCVFFLIVHGKIMVRDGQTWGKKLLNIKISTMENELPNVSVLIKRYGFYWVIPQIPVVGQVISLINVLFVFTKSKRCLHDYVADTKVVKVEK